MIDISGEIVLGLYEFEFSLKCGIHLCELPELLLLDSVDLLLLIDPLSELVSDLGLRLNLRLQICDHQVLTPDLLLGLLEGLP